MRSILVLALLVLFPVTPAGAGTLIFSDDCEHEPDTKNDYIRAETGGSRIRFSDEQAYTGSGSYKVTVEPGRGLRAELVPTAKVPGSGNYNAPFGSHMWWGYSFFIPENWEKPTGFNIAGQWHKALYKDCNNVPYPYLDCDSRCGRKNPASPQPLAISIAGTSDAPKLGILITGMDDYIACRAPGKYKNWNYWKTFTSAEITKGKWHTIVVYYSPVHNSATGRVTAWLDGEEFADVTDYTAHNDDLGPYFKWGLYLSSTKEHTIYLDELKIVKGAPGEDCYYQVAPAFSDDGVTTSNNDLAVKGFTLIDAFTDSDLRALANGSNINLSQDGSMLNIRADVEGDPGSVVFSGSLEHTENVSPYALAGDDQEDYHSWTPRTGNFTITATPYSLANGRGQAGKSMTITFAVSR